MSRPTSWAIVHMRSDEEFINPIILRRYPTAMQAHRHLRDLRITHLVRTWRELGETAWKHERRYLDNNWMVCEVPW